MGFTNLHFLHFHGDVCLHKVQICCTVFTSPSPFIAFLEAASKSVRSKHSQVPYLTPNLLSVQSYHQCSCAPYVSFYETRVEWVGCKKMTCSHCMLYDHCVVIRLCVRPAKSGEWVFWNKQRKDLFWGEDSIISIIDMEGGWQIKGEHLWREYF